MVLSVEMLRRQSDKPKDVLQGVASDINLISISRSQKFALLSVRAFSALPYVRCRFIRLLIRNRLFYPSAVAARGVGSSPRKMLTN